MSYIVFDLEATCGEKYQNIRNETIEIGAVKLNRSLEIVDEFNEFIHPIIYPTLSKFCMELTSITQADVDNADQFSDVIKRFRSWIGEDYLLISWSVYDKKQLSSDCDLHHLDRDWAYTHLDLRNLYAGKKHVDRCGLKIALKREGIPIEGTLHRGIDDARNLTKLFIKDFPLWGIK